MKDLKWRLERVKEGSRSLSIEVLQALGWGAVCPKWGHMEAPDGSFCHFQDIPSPTVSVDAALKLIPKGWIVDSLYQSTSGEWWDCSLVEDGAGEQLVSTDLGCASPALALCSAIIQAHSKKG